MQIKVNSEQRIYRKKLLIILPIVLVIVLFLSAYVGMTPSVTANNLWLEPIQQGKLDISVTAHGALKSNHQLWLITESGGTVASINVHPGDAVSPDTVVIELKNPALELEYQNGKLREEENRAELQSLSASLKGELLQAEAKLNELTETLSAQQLELNAFEQLVNKSIVSKLQYEKQRLYVQRLNSSLQSETRFLVELKSTHLARLKAQNARFLQQQEYRKGVGERLEKLKVKANTDAIVQQLAPDLTEGKVLVAGSPILELGKKDDLFAQVNIPAVRAKEVRLGMTVDVDLRSATIIGNVRRIDPRAVNDQVVVDVSLADKLPEEARPEIPITASIILKTIENATFVRRPPNANPLSSHPFHVINSNNPSYLVKQVVQFGSEGGNYLLVERGVTLGDQILMSDLGELNEYERIKITGGTQ